MLTMGSSSAAVIPLRSADRLIPTIAPVRDRETASRFLHLLDPAAQDFTFQTFDDRHRTNGRGPNGLLARDTADRK